MPVQNDQERKMSSAMVFPVRSWKSGKLSATRISAATMATPVIAKDSPMNWRTSCPRFAPKAFRSATSRLRVSERAVAMFMKLKQASRTMTTVSAPSSSRYVPLPFSPASFSS